MDIKQLSRTTGLSKKDLRKILLKSLRVSPRWKMRNIKTDEREVYSEIDHCRNRLMNLYSFRKGVVIRTHPFENRLTLIKQSLKDKKMQDKAIKAIFDEISPEDIGWYLHQLEFKKPKLK